MTFLGGRGTLWGPVLGAGILEAAQQLLAYWLGGSQVYLIAYAAVFLVIMLLLPRGILPTIQDRIRRRRRPGTVNAVAVPPALPLAEVTAGRGPALTPRLRAKAPPRPFAQA